MYSSIDNKRCDWNSKLNFLSLNPVVNEMMDGRKQEDSWRFDKLASKWMKGICKVIESTESSGAA